MAHIELEIAQLYYIFEVNHIVDMLHVKKSTKESLQNDLQNGPIFTQHIGTISHHRTRISPEGGLLDSSDINYHWSVDCCCWVRLESKVEEIVVVHVIFHLLIFEQILVFVVVVNHLFLQAHFHCLFLFAHNEEECTSVLASIWVFGEAFLWEAFRDFLAEVDVLDEFLLHGCGKGELLVGRLVFLKIDLVVLGEISHLVHDTGEVSDLCGHMVLQLVVVEKLGLSSNVGLGHYIVGWDILDTVLVSSLSRLSVMNLVNWNLLLYWLESESRSVESLWLLLLLITHLWLSELLLLVLLVLWLLLVLLELLLLWELLELLLLVVLLVPLSVLVEWYSL